MSRQPRSKFARRSLSISAVAYKRLLLLADGKPLCAWVESQINQAFARAPRVPVEESCLPTSATTSLPSPLSRPAAGQEPVLISCGDVRESAASLNSTALAVGAAPPMTSPKSSAPTNHRPARRVSGDRKASGSLSSGSDLARPCEPGTSPKEPPCRASTAAPVPSAPPATATAGSTASASTAGAGLASASTGEAVTGANGAPKRKTTAKTTPFNRWQGDRNGVWIPKESPAALAMHPGRQVPLEEHLRAKPHKPSSDVPRDAREICVPRGETNVRNF